MGSSLGSVSVVLVRQTADAATVPMRKSVERWPVLGAVRLNAQVGISRSRGGSMGFVAGDRVAWSRWWGPEGVENTLFSGVLPDPQGEYTKFLNRYVRQLKDYAACRALVLMGDPGMGKSSELEAEVDRRRHAGEHVEHLLLRNFHTPGEVRDGVREADAGWRSAGSPGDLVLALDGFDEPLFAASSLASALEGALGGSTGAVFGY